MNQDKTAYKKHLEGLKILADEKRKQEIYPVNPDGESLAKLEMLSELQSLGYDYLYFSDIELATIKSREVMRVLLKYYPLMESYLSKETILTKIDPKIFPEVFSYAYELLLQYTPFERMSMTGLQQTLARGIMNDKHISVLFDLVKDPNGYASCSIIKEKLCKTVPEMMRPLSFAYCEGILLIPTLKDFSIYGDEESLYKLKECAFITNEMIDKLKMAKFYSLNASLYEYYIRFFERDRVQKEAAYLLKKAIKHLSS